MTKVSDLRDRVRFEQKGVDAHGRRTGAWDGDGDGFDVAAGLTWLHRGEAVLQARLQGASPVVIKVWSSARTRAVTNAWRATDLRTGRVLNLTSPGEPSTDRAFVEFLAQADGTNA